MEVFHWVASEIKDMPLFSTEYEVEDDRTGAIYNDFDRENPFHSEDETSELEFSFTKPTSTKSPTQKFVGVDQEEVDNVILDEIGYPGGVFFDCMNFDCDSEYPDKVYRKRVYDLLVQEVHKIKITDEVLKVFEKRRSNDWQGPDSVYDLWLLGMGESRTWFPIEVFEAEYPDFQEQVEKSVQEMEREQEFEEEQESEKESERDTCESDTIITKISASKRKRKIISSESEEEFQRVKLKFEPPEEAIYISSDEELFKVKKEITEVIELSD